MTNFLRYDSSIPFIKNVELTEPILSRFDILCVVKDRVDAEIDRRLATFVVKSHVRSHPLHASEDADGYKLENLGPIPQELLRKYIVYARSKIRPQLGRINTDKIAKLFVSLRAESKVRAVERIQLLVHSIVKNFTVNMEMAKMKKVILRTSSCLPFV